MTLLNTVVSGGFCVGCGACAAVKDSGYSMKFTDRYSPIAIAGQPESSALTRVCPFSAEGPDETSLSESLFPRAHTNKFLGRYLKNYAGHRNAEARRVGGSSGGLTSWFLERLVQDNIVDAVIHVKPRPPSDTDPRLFAYGVSTSVAELQSATKSHYYPAEVSQVLATVRETPGRYAIVGVPCVIKALRRLALEDPLLAERMTILVGIFCGHMKSSAFAEALAWETGIEPGRLQSMDFRHKLMDKPASDYAFAARGTNSTGDRIEAVKRMRNTLVYDWGKGWFRLPACDYCDDVTAETADISFGDAWLPEYVADPRGTNLVVVRGEVAKTLLEAFSYAVKEVHLEALEPERVVESQSSAFAHRRDGLSYRLWLKERRGLWHPPKRVKPGKDNLSLSRRLIYRMRMLISFQSHHAFRVAKSAGSYRLFAVQMLPVVAVYKVLNLRGGLQRRLNSFWRALTKASRSAIGMLVNR